jgi:hypothetical protein
MTKKKGQCHGPLARIAAAKILALGRWRIAAPGGVRMSQPCGLRVQDSRCRKDLMGEHRRDPSARSRGPFLCRCASQPTRGGDTLHSSNGIGPTSSTAVIGMAWLHYRLRRPIGIIFCPLLT